MLHSHPSRFVPDVTASHSTMAAAHHQPPMHQEPTENNPTLELLQINSYGDTETLVATDNLFHIELPPNENEASHRIEQSSKHRTRRETVV